MKKIIQLALFFLATNVLAASHTSTIDETVLTDPYATQQVDSVDVSASVSISAAFAMDYTISDNGGVIGGFDAANADVQAFIADNTSSTDCSGALSSSAEDLASGGVETYYFLSSDSTTMNRKQLDSNVKCTMSNDGTSNLITITMARRYLFTNYVGPTARLTFGNQSGIYKLDELTDKDNILLSSAGSPGNFQTFSMDTTNRDFLIATDVVFNLDNIMDSSNAVSGVDNDGSYFATLDYSVDLSHLHANL